MTAELRKLVAHRTPKVAVGMLLLAALVPSIALSSSATTEFNAVETKHTIFMLVSMLCATYLGAWALGTEYRQHTIRRLLVTDPVRLRVFGRKFAAGASLFATMFAASATIGWFASRQIASTQQRFDALYAPELATIGIVALAMFAIAFGLSAIGKGMVLAVAFPIGLVFMFGPLLGTVPNIGRFTLWHAIDSVVNSQSAFRIVTGYEHPVSQSVLAIVVWVAAILGLGALAFHRQEA